MLWRILPHVTACMADDRIIMLDIRRDRYFQVPAHLTPVMADWLNSADCAPPRDDLLAMFSRSGVACAGDPPPSNTARDRINIPTNPISPVWSRDSGGSASLSILATVMSTWASLRLRRLADVLHDHHFCDVPLRRQHLDLFDLSAHFERGRRFSPIARRCLIDTLALHTWLGEAGRGCQIIFGVTAAPFRAHCWLQAPVGVLNDSFDHVSRYTPILAV